MIIKQAKFITSVADADKIPNYNAVEIAIAGKSNVGKSSFINFIANYGKLAKTSSEPGRTRLLNYFEINGGDFYFVDLPGYGFARVSQAEKIRWSQIIEAYLLNSKNLINVFVLVDIRHAPTDDDKQLLSYLYAYSIPFTIIATKADKLSKLQQANMRSQIANDLKVGRDDVIITSSLKKLGKDAVLQRIDSLISANVKTAFDGDGDATNA